MAGAKILVIDDDPDIVETYVTVLKNKGYDVRSAANGTEGLAAAKAERPDAIILDIMMEEADSGMKVAETLGTTIPILMVSSIAEASDQIFDTTKLPISDFAEKPIPADKLVEKIERLLAKARQTP